MSERWRLPAILFLAGLALIVFYYLSTSPGERPEVAEAPATAAEGPFLEIDVAGAASGTIVIDLNAEAAPAHVERIVTLAGEGAYDNVVFHRVIEGFMAQTGDVEFGRLGMDMRRAGTGGSDLPDLAAEFTDLPFERGVMGMARSQSPDSANSQFFLMFGAAPHLNGGYTVVGEIVEGLDVLDAIKRGEGPNGAVIGAPDVMEAVRVRP